MVIKILQLLVCTFIGTASCALYNTPIINYVKFLDYDSILLNLLAH